MLRNSLEKILLEYRHAAEEEFAGNPLAAFLRKDLPAGIRLLIPSPERYKVAGSAGQGRWARAPWVAVLDLLITDTPQEGYYPVYLFREDFSAVYLSLNQGVTSVRKAYRAEAKEALQARAQDYRAQLGNLADEFAVATIDLRPSAASNDSAYYEAGNICAKIYEAGKLPTDEVLQSDFGRIMRLYDYLSFNESLPVGGGTQEDDEEGNQHIEDLQTFRLHKRIERNQRLVREVKRLQGYTCKLCGFDFERQYGPIGHEYIEAHHLTPLSRLKGERLVLDPRADFAVLCANCHRMMHRSELVHDLIAFREKHLSKGNDSD
jgi:5-methylcytosine-specific restriction enzyme A